MPKGRLPGAVSGSDPIVKFVKFLSWGYVAALKNARGSHLQAVKWVDSAMPWFRSYYHAVYGVELTDIRLLNIVSTYAARYLSWPDCDRVRTYAFKQALPPFVQKALITEAQIREVLIPKPQASTEALDSDIQCTGPIGPLDTTVNS